MGLTGLPIRNRISAKDRISTTLFHPAIAGTIGLVFNVVVALIVSAVTPSREKRFEYYRIFELNFE